MEARSKVWPEERITGSDIISKEMGHLKSAGNSTAILVILEYCGCVTVYVGWKMGRGRDREGFMRFTCGLFCSEKKSVSCEIVRTPHEYVRV